ncbi:uncharacterized protein LOC130753649 [Actinidia eriantha]|uniref:uncharacterized protein LOC130753649 n=1 Tax=Actinidia eriantha TaxID=165200 RepID=UPI00258C3E8D|nr:uncharacterized protein LOC130753649 [Actinidia eriantha]
MEGEKQKLLLDNEIREMTSALAHRLADLQRHVHMEQTPSTQLQQDHDHDGFRIITLTGSNTGAAMRGQLDDKYWSSSGHGEHGDEANALATYVNSNFQAINNSVMLGGTYSTNDPGVRLDMDMTISDHDHLQQHPHSHPHMKHGKLNPKKKDKHTSRTTDQHDSQSSSSD